jgi:hypothetical protein
VFGKVWQTRGVAVRPAVGVRSDVVSPQELAGFRDGDPDAVRAVSREFGSLVFAVRLRALGSRDLAEEATQQTFVKGRFGSERGVGV